MPAQPFALSPWFNNWLAQYAKTGPNLAPPGALDQLFQNQAGITGQHAQDIGTLDAMRTAGQDPALAGALGLVARANARNMGANQYQGFLGNYAQNAQDFWNQLMRGNQQQQGQLIGQGGQIGGGNFWSSLAGDVLSPALGKIGTGLGDYAVSKLPFMAAGG